MRSSQAQRASFAYLFLVAMEAALVAMLGA